MGTQLPSPKNWHSLPQFSAHVYFGQTAGWIKMPLGMEVGLVPGHTVLDGDPPLKRGTASSNFRPMSVVAKRLDGSRCHLHEGRPRPRQQCVRCGRSSTTHGSQHPPQFSTHVCCGQTAGWIKMALGRKLGLGPGHIVLHGKWGPSAPKFSAHFYCGQTVAHLSYW